MARTVDSPFAERPELAPTFKEEAGANGRKRLSGFNFLDGVVYINRHPNPLTERQLTCATMAILGFTNIQIHNRMRISKGTAINDLATTYNKLSVPNKAALFVGCLVNEVMTIDKYGSPKLFPASEDDLQLLRMVASGAMDSAIANELNITQNVVSKQLRDIGFDSGVAKRELLVTSAIITGQIDPDDIIFTS